MNFFSSIRFILIRSLKFSAYFYHYSSIYQAFKLQFSYQYSVPIWIRIIQVFAKNYSATNFNLKRVRTERHDKLRKDPYFIWNMIYACNCTFIVLETRSFCQFTSDLLSAQMLTFRFFDIPGCNFEVFQQESRI